MYRTMDSERLHRSEDGAAPASQRAAASPSGCGAGAKTPRAGGVFRQRFKLLLIGGGLFVGLIIAVLPPDWHDGFRLGGMPLIHVMGFAAATLVMALLLGGGWRILPIAGGLFCYGMLIEIAQTQAEWRSGKLDDLSYNAAGIALGVGLYVSVPRRLRSAGLTRRRFYERRAGSSMRQGRNSSIRLIG